MSFSISAHGHTDPGTEAEILEWLRELVDTFRAHFHGAVFSGSAGPIDLHAGQTAPATTAPGLQVSTDPADLRTLDTQGPDVEPDAEPVDGNDAAPVYSGPATPLTPPPADPLPPLPNPDAVQAPQTEPAPETASAAPTEPAES